MTNVNDVAQIENIKNTNDPGGKLSDWIITSGVSAKGSGITGSGGNLTALIISSLSGPELNGILQMHNSTHIRSLDASHNNFTGVNLSGLTSLMYLNLENSQTSNISTLSSLNNLTILDLYNNQISDISALSGLNNLAIIYLDNNRIPLAQLYTAPAASGTRYLGHQANVYFYKRLQLIDMLDSYNIAAADAWINGAATSGTVTGSSGAFFTPSGGSGQDAVLSFSETGDYILTLTNPNVPISGGSSILGQSVTSTFVISNKKPSSKDPLDESKTPNGRNLASAMASSMENLAKLLLQQGYLEAKTLGELNALNQFINIFNADGGSNNW